MNQQDIFLDSLALAYKCKVAVTVEMALAIALISLLMYASAGVALDTKTEAETMTRSGGGVVIQSNSSASGGREVGFHSNGSANTSFSGGASRIILRAKGISCQGQPMLKVYVDGVLKGTASLTSNTYSNYVLSLSGVGSGSHALRVSFENDLTIGNCSRVAYLDYFVLTQPDPPPPVGTKPTCTDSLQAKIDAAPTGSTVSVRGDCIYRQQVSISKALTLVGQSGAEIRGSNVFSGWSAAGGNWVSSSTVPTLGTNPSDASCQPNTSECTRPEQVFINGTPQTQVAVGVDPAAGQFALDSSRRVVLGSDPSGKQVEVTVRQRWVRVNAGGVTIDNIDMRHAGNGAGYQAALLDDRGSNFTIKNSQLSYAHGAVLGMSGSSSMRAENNDIHHGGQLGIHSYGGTTILTNNKIHDNNVADYNSGWEAAGLKATFQSGSQWTNNEVYNNDGTGLWCDLKCDSVTIANNRIHHNEKSAIFYEISSRGTIRDNVVWENGWRYPGGAWTAAIRATNCDGCEIARNTLAWNYSGISVIATRRTEQPLTRNNWVHDNRIYFKDYPSSVVNNSCSRPHALAYCQSYASTIYSSNNRGNSNRYYFPTAEGTIARYYWGGIGYTRLSAFNGTLGEEGASYLSTAEKDSALSSLGVPTSPSR